MNDDSSPQSDNKMTDSISAHSGANIDAKTQDMLNTPANTSTTSLSDDDKKFLEDLDKKIESGDIDLLKPSSIMNEEVYESLTGENKAKADMFVNSSLFVMRQIHEFYKSDYANESDMMINMVQELRHKKETLEQDIGDILKI